MVFAGAPKKVPVFLAILLAVLFTLAGLVGLITATLAEEISAGINAATAATAQIEAVFRNLFDTNFKLL